ncbi:nucleotidyl transferase AbiEii/AbiGii toxin family protein [Brevibacillus laterosporus]|uniref:nucleotidyl transferase AbiEii/AbiGii toxin family protein n=1 Tax=Brevibacillus laterosporus TaxID=1465 RepID=UPI0014441098|nr:nucleotidyl transferase AbiEii/AbiGii toxin family protein [Brevibacillus laterosporus]NKQ22775.1 nucleotidyl transferase AbiEii/AbiGii toxin family protein [Brevibacillus laterosporus]WNX33769.1 nucleotidyl transferase AbiEii/AbiGii toxin family protein [Brevibacillus laterosporus]
MRKSLKTHIVPVPEELERIRKLTIISLFSDDDLMDILVLKGGNALEIAHKLHSRASTDIDVSMKMDFGDANLNIEEVTDKLTGALYDTFAEAGYLVFDVRLVQKPRNLAKGQIPQWGGYKASFKIISKNDQEASNPNLEVRRNRSLVLNGDKRSIDIDISKYEYCEGYEEHDLEGYTIKVYSLKMIVLEKLRAICQQMDEYAIRTKKSPRSRDFYDIYVICESDSSNQINFKDRETRDMLRNFFEIKKVPLELLNKVAETKDFHKEDFHTVKDSVKANVVVEEFEFYFDYVLKKIKDLESFWVE